MYQLGWEKAEELEATLPTSTGSYKNKWNSKKNICFIDCAKAFDFVDHNKLENS